MYIINLLKNIIKNTKMNNMNCYDNIVWCNYIIALTILYGRIYFCLNKKNEYNFFYWNMCVIIIIINRSYYEL